MVDVADPDRIEVPAGAVLETGLRMVLADRRVVVVARERNIYATTFPGEIVTCRLGNGRTLRLLCKYHDSRGARRHDHGHRGGIPHEARVYRHLVAPAAPSAAHCYGTYHEAERDTTWLVLEYLEGSIPLRHSTDPEVMVKAARWIGQFHAAHDARPGDMAPDGWIRYDASYYEGWARRTVDYAGELHGRYPWLAGLCERFIASLEILTAAPPTVIHGEYYPQNILVRDGVIYPIDWESGALAAGEIDLATLTERWPDAVARQCEAAYRSARWPGGAPQEHGARLTMARIYAQLRWLGDRVKWTVDETVSWRYAALQAVGGD